MIIDEVNKLMQYQTFTKHKIISHNKANILETNLNFRDNINIVHSEDDGVIDTNEFIKLLINNKLIKNIGYDCKSCVFCQASVNLLSKKIINMNSDKVFDLCNDAINFYKSKEYQDAHSILKDYAERQHQTIEGA